MEKIEVMTKEGFTITKYIYTPEEEKERERLFAKNKYESNSDTSWGGQGTIQGQSNYGKFGDGGQ